MLSDSKGKIITLLLESLGTVYAFRTPIHVKQYSSTWHWLFSWSNF